MFFVFDSNIVRSNHSWVASFSSTPKIGHASYLVGLGRDIVSLFVARSIIKSTWQSDSDTYLVPQGKKGDE